MDMDDGARLWTIKTARANFWRVYKWYELDDLIQDGYWQFYRIQSRYPEAKQRAHVMSLYKRAFSNWITDLSNRKTLQAEVVEFDLIREMGLPEQSGDSLWDVLMATPPDPSSFILALSTAPRVLRKLIEVLGTDDGAYALLRPFRVRRVGRETWNERLCAIAGAHAQDVNLVKLLNQQFGHY